MQMPQRDYTHMQTYLTLSPVRQKRRSCCHSRWMAVDRQGLMPYKGGIWDE